MRNSAQEWQTTFDAISDGVVVVDVKGEILRCNRAMTEIIGKPAGEIIRRKCHEIIPGGSEVERCLFSRAKAAGKGETGELEFGGKKYQYFIDLIRNIQGNIVGGVGKIMDITERRKLEERLLQSQRLEAIGQLAGGIAHDFNNLMTSVLGYSSLILNGLAENDVLRADLEEIHKAGKRASLLTQQLLAFSRKQMLKVQLTDLNSLVRDMVIMLQRLIGEDIKLFLELEPKIEKINLDPGQVEQVIMNLVLNARDAMPGGGKITFSTENVNISGKENKILPGARPGRFVRFSVQDNGIGMNEEILKRIFEPFFTTKEKNKGTGLGLSTAYGIIAQHEGWINVESEPKKGAIFKVYLPVVNTAIEKEIIEEAAVILNEHKGKGERILLVEDEENVRKFVCRLLADNGYDVCDAVDARQALEIFKRDTGNFQLVFSDVVLPDKNGLQLAEELLLLKPDLAVVLVSGYLDEKSQLAAVQEKGLVLLQKPYPASLLFKTFKEQIKPK
ncbi:MAG: ATP-binding protein [Elusimicrobiota bacterium]